MSVRAIYLHLLETQQIKYPIKPQKTKKRGKF
jgi:hypothetical protein